MGKKGQMCQDQAASASQDKRIPELKAPGPSSSTSQFQGSSPAPHAPVFQETYRALTTLCQALLLGAGPAPHQRQVTRASKPGHLGLVLHLKTVLCSSVVRTKKSINNE